MAMARPPTGSVVARPGKDGLTYALRFRAYGRRQYVTTKAATREEALVELEETLVLVKRGLWKSPAPAAAVEVVVEEPTFRVYASEWVERRRHEVDERTVEHWRWALWHLLEH